MSVINRMLRQLDARAATAPAGLPGATSTVAPGAQPSAQPGAQPGEPAPASRRRLRMMVLLGGGAIAAVALADLSPLQPQPAAVVPMAMLSTAPTLVQEATPAALATPPPAAEPEPPRAAPPPASPPPASPLPAAPAAAPKPARPEAAAAAPVAAASAVAAVAAAWPMPTPTLPRIDKRALPGTAAERAALAHRDAMDLARLGQNQAALQRALQAVAQDPAHAAARQLAAVLQHESGASDSALALLREGAAAPAAPPALTLLLARLLAAQGLDAEALSWLDRQDLRSGEAQGLRAGLLAQQGQYALALPAYESAVQQQPGNPMWWFGLAVALESEGQGPRARQAFAQARHLRLPREDLDAYADQRLRALP